MSEKTRRQPDVNAVKEAFAHFCETVAALRDPKTGCPWDLQQSHKSLRSFMLEEAYEAYEAMSSDSPEEICGELGDVLLQVVLNSQLASEEDNFDICDVINSIDKKMLRRHPHVFGSEKQKEDRSIRNIKSTWQTIKRDEEQKDGLKEEPVFKKAKKKRPATLQALEIGKIASRIDFDWKDVEGVHKKLLSEVEELNHELGSSENENMERVADELGDMYFTLAQLCRHLKLDPEIVALDANRKFLRRFSIMERYAKTDGIDIRTTPQPELEKLWDRSKLEDKK